MPHVLSMFSTPSLLLLLVALVMIVCVPIVRAARGWVRSVAFYFARAMLVASVSCSVLVGCTPAERCAAARGASIAAKVLEEVAARACENGGLLVGSSGGELEAIEDTTEAERAEALEALEAAAAELR